jgi:hypothetical protein
MAMPKRVINLGFPPIVNGHLRSVELGGTQDLRTDLSLIGIGATWTIGWWMTDLSMPGTTRRGLIMITHTSIRDNEIFLYARTAASAGADRFSADIKDETGNAVPNTRGVWNPDSVAPLNVWSNYITTFDSSGGDTKPNMYKDGVQQTRTDITGATVSQTTGQTRRIKLFQTAPQTGLPLAATVGHIGIWNSVLSADERNEIANPTTGTPFELDLRVDTGDYVSSANLVNYWRPGWDTRDPWKQWSEHADALPLTVQINPGTVIEDAPA